MNIYDPEAKSLIFTVMGSSPHVVKQTEVRMIELEVDETVIMSESFYEEDLILNLANRLNIPLSDIRIVEAVNENDVQRAKRSMTGTVKIEIEIGRSPSKTNEFVPKPYTEDTSETSTDTEKGMLDYRTVFAYLDITNIIIMSLVNNKVLDFLYIFKHFNFQFSKCGWLSCYVMKLVVSSLRAVVLPGFNSLFR